MFDCYFAVTFGFVNNAYALTSKFHEMFAQVGHLFWLNYFWLQTQFYYHIKRTNIFRYSTLLCVFILHDG